MYNNSPMRSSRFKLVQMLCTAFLRPLLSCESISLLMTL